MCGEKNAHVRIFLTTHVTHPYYYSERPRRVESWPKAQTSGQPPHELRREHLIANKFTWMGKFLQSI
ncbi:hypothetical protein KDAU_30520 [Dictyobacter aurantiacus]|uniref:Uncharacterized protein n=1 Tax=Dictyobacter aurantiacus TaxID=1936993 RepID=A0A401ZFZ4_9CHLR|nr:hypothetical protein KDAU_30520 [Dictyobacter aurantiacus]